MFNLARLVEDNDKFRDAGMAGTPPPHVQRALQRHAEYEEATIRTRKVTEQQGRAMLDAHGKLYEKVNRRHPQRADVEEQLASYIEREVLPRYDDPWLRKVTEAMRSCHHHGVWYLDPTEDRTIIRWTAECESLHLCPHEAAKEAQRAVDRYTPQFVELRRQGYIIQKAVIAPRNIERHRPAKSRSLTQIVDAMDVDTAGVVRREISLALAAAGAPSSQAKRTARELTPRRDILGQVENRLQRHMMRMFRKLELMPKATWPKSVKRRLHLLALDDTPANRAKVKKLRGRLFPGIKGMLATMESPLSWEGWWHPHLNVMFAIKGAFPDWKLFWRWWDAHVEVTTEQQMVALTESRMRARGEDVSELTFDDVMRHALKEVVKYPLATVAEKSVENRGTWSGGELGEGVFLSTDVDRAGHARPLAPPMTQWPADAFMEWLYAHNAFRRTRSYGVLFGFEGEDEEPVSTDPDHIDTLKGDEAAPAKALPMGEVRRISGAYYVSLPLLAFLPGDNSAPTPPSRFQKLLPKYLLPPSAEPPPPDPWRDSYEQAEELEIWAARTAELDRMHPELGPVGRREREAWEMTKRTAGHLGTNVYDLTAELEADRAEQERLDLEYARARGLA